MRVSCLFYIGLSVSPRPQKQKKNAKRSRFTAHRTLWPRPDTRSFCSTAIYANEAQIHAKLADILMVKYAFNRSIYCYLCFGWAQFVPGKCVPLICIWHEPDRSNSESVGQPTIYYCICFKQSNGECERRSAGAMRLVNFDIFCCWCFFKVYGNGGWVVFACAHTLE